MAKKQGRHPDKSLNAKRVAAIKEPGFYADGNGLYLKVDKTGAKRWVQRLVIHNRRRDLGLGSATLVTLAEARGTALQNRKVARAGGDPIAERKKITGVMTFEEAAKAVHRLYLPTWSNPKQGQQWLNTLTTYAFPVLGSKKVDAITTGDVLAALSPIWTEKPETASRVRQRISAVLKWAIAKGWRADNPAADIASALPKRSKAVTHHKSLPYPEVASAIHKVQACDASASTKLALEFLILTASRSGEVRNAEWSEVDGDVWTVPAERMKQRKPHRVPLSARCLAILAEAKKVGDGSGLIFPSAATGRALSDNTLSKLVRELGIDCVPHGFRSSFRMWAGEKTNIPREVCEFALAHVVGDAAERAYQRSDLFDKRRLLMDQWAQYLEAKGGEVVHLQERAR